MKKRYAPVPYHNLWIRIILAVLATHILMFYNDERTFWQAIHTTIYYISLIENFLLTLLIISIVHLVTVILDLYFDWQHDMLYRIILQAVVGVLLPIVLAIWLATLFYSFNGMEIEETDYFTLVLPLIKAMILTLNILYFAHYIYLTKYKPMLDGEIPYSAPLMTFGRQNLIEDAHWKKKQLLYEGYKDLMLSKEIIDYDEENSSIDEIWVSFNATHLKFDIASEISFFHCEDSCTKVYTHTGKNFKVKHSLSHYEKLLHNKLFFQINRSTLMNGNLIRGYKSGANRTLILILELPFTPNEKLKPEIITVPREKAVEFKKWLQN